MIVSLAGLSGLPQSARKPALFKRACLKALGARKAGNPGEINIVFVDRKKMLALNKSFLNHTHDTDVIAFGYENSRGLISGSPFGDIYISTYQARRQAKELGHGVLKEVLTLVLHGTLHLLGYDDSTLKQRAVMFRRQDQLLKGL